MGGKRLQTGRKRAPTGDQAALDGRLCELIKVLGRAVALRWRQDYAETQRADSESDAQDSTATR